DDLLQRVQALRADDSIAGVDITHGTDSMEDTAMALELFHTGKKPVVITGAQRSFDHLESDGPQNLADAISYAANGAPGVSIRFGGLTIPARGAFRAHTSALEAFQATSQKIRTRLTRAQAPRAGQDVVINPAWPGAPRLLVDDAVAYGINGIIVEGLCSGNTGTEMCEADKDALDAGIPALTTTRVPEGSVTL